MISLISLLVALWCGAHAQLSDPEVAQFTGSKVSDEGTYWTFSSTGQPVTADYDMFPDPRLNPNTITAQDHQFTIPKSVTYLDEPTCLPMGPIAVAVDGTPFYNPYTAENTDAVLNEAFDSCQGHPDPKGAYHYHQNSECLHTADCSDPAQWNKLIGVAFDGVPMYGMCDGSGQELSSGDLDACHGAPLSASDPRYVYRATRDFPYLIGCYAGQVDSPRPLTEGSHCQYAIANGNGGSNGGSTETGGEGEEGPGPGGQGGPGGEGGERPRPGGEGEESERPKPGGERGQRPRPGGRGGFRPRPGGERGERPGPVGEEANVDLLKRLLDVLRRKRQEEQRPPPSGDSDQGDADQGQGREDQGEEGTSYSRNDHEGREQLGQGQGGRGRPGESSQSREELDEGGLGQVGQGHSQEGQGQGRQGRGGPVQGGQGRGGQSQGGQGRGGQAQGGQGRGGQGQRGQGRGGQVHGGFSSQAFRGRRQGQRMENGGQGGQGETGQGRVGLGHSGQSRGGEYQGSQSQEGQDQEGQGRKGPRKGDQSQRGPRPGGQSRWGPSRGGQGEDGKGRMGQGQGGQGQPEQEGRVGGGGGLDMEDSFGREQGETGTDGPWSGEQEGNEGPPPPRGQGAENGASIAILKRILQHVMNDI